ncbi:MAG: AAA family ATPase [Alphaproteobacteria bacterium]|nr:AAA family ATPase [Alphaproteobacteria bacterium]
MRLTSIRIKNFKVLRDVSIDNIPQFMVLVGANGSGKSSFFDLFGFLGDALRNNVRQALQKRGGFTEVVSRGCADQTILIELKFTMQLLDRERLVTYVVEIGKTAHGQPVVMQETLRYKRGAYGHPFNFIKFSQGQGYAVSNEEDFNKPDEELTRENQTLDAPDILALKGLGQFQRFKAASAVRSLIENWYLSDFHINAARGAKDAGYAEHLSADGDNLPLVTQYLFESHPKLFRQVLDKMARRVPGVAQVEAKPTEDGRIVLRFQDGTFKDPFVSRYVSDGTIKMFAYLVLLHDPTPHPLLCVEEPENQLYYSLLGELAEEFEAYARRGGQVIVSTHSPDFLDAVSLDSIFWLEKRDGFSTAARATADSQLVALVKEGDMPGRLWAQKLFGKVDP